MRACVRGSAGNACTGGACLQSLVVVEGGVKAIKKYKKLMLQVLHPFLSFDG